MNLKELRGIAKQHGIRGYSKLKKAELESTIREFNPSAFDAPRSAERRSVASSGAEQTTPPVSEEKDAVKVAPSASESDVHPPARLELLTNRGLRDMAKSRGLKNWSKLNKKQLVDLLS